MEVQVYIYIHIYMYKKFIKYKCIAERGIGKCKRLCLVVQMQTAQGDCKGVSEKNDDT